MQDWLFVGAAGGIIMAAWGYIKSIWQYVTSLLIVRVECTGMSGALLRHQLQWHWQTASLGNISLIGFRLFITTVRKSQIVIFQEVPPGGKFYRNGWQIVWAKFSPTTPNGNTNEAMTLVYLRGTLDLEAFIRHSLTTYVAAENTFSHSADGAQIVNRFGTAKRHANATDVGAAGQIFRDRASTFNGPSSPEGDVFSRRSLTHDISELGQRSTDGLRITDMSLTAEGQQLVEEFGRWFESKDWYESRLIPWRRAWLLTGPPGTGKTSTVRALAQQYRLPVQVMHIGTMYNEELFHNWTSAVSTAPCIILIEDIDAVFNGRETKQGDITFDALLNCMDGIASNSGVAVFVTTNNPEKLDIALAADGVTTTRPGRIDRIVAFRPLDADGRLKMVQRILVEHPETHAELVEKHAGLTGAQFQDVCTQLALNRFWLKEVSVNG